MVESVEVVIIGAGPSGTIAAALLQRNGHDVVVLEQNEFPRFAIGESLLPYCMEFIEQAGMMDAVTAAGFQLKNGAVFAGSGMFESFDFHEKFSS
ncbi:MAG: tryptophan 7-halogenase, partial [Porticoccus sp.]|nr:tryptophan 7-halogenase [Porticoccus sp.]MBQ0807566.1 tryptophan 7-halogenase [Porticoccus sp.]